MSNEYRRPGPEQDPRPVSPASPRASPAGPQLTRSRRRWLRARPATGSRWLRARQPGQPASYGRRRPPGPRWVRAGRLRACRPRRRRWRSSRWCSGIVGSAAAVLRAQHRGDRHRDHRPQADQASRGQPTRAPAWPSRDSILGGIGIIVGIVLLDPQPDGMISRNFYVRPPPERARAARPVRQGASQLPAGRLRSTPKTTITTANHPIQHSCGPVRGTGRAARPVQARRIQRSHRARAAAPSPRTPGCCWLRRGGRRGRGR